MTEVYRGKRTVPIKVLPSPLSDYPNVKQRFGREAKTISSLSHPQGEALRPMVNQAETRLRKLITSTKVWLLRSPRSARASPAASTSHQRVAE